LTEFGLSLIVLVVLNIMPSASKRTLPQIAIVPSPKHPTLDRRKSFLFL
jgi:hypothetical protein